MLSPLDVAAMSGRRSRYWPGGGTKIPNRRLLMCRFPILALWSLIVIFILYKSLIRSDVGGPRNEVATHSDDQEQLNLKRRQLLIRRSSSQSDNHETSRLSTPVGLQQSVITNLPNRIISSTRKSVEDYARLSKVFILIIQDEKYGSVGLKQALRRSTIKEGSSAAVASSGTAGYHGLILPAHIGLLISILESHRIEYTVDTTRTGLPTALLTDQDNSSESKQYSVIVIDDFIKYTKLSRWARDQLDRHCRINKIGVVTYLTSEGLERQRSERAHDQLRTSNDRLSKGLGSQHSSTEESLADQFPITFKTIEQESCLNSSSRSCLVDYQLNDRSAILRLLKRKQNFIINGAHRSNLNQSPWISMSSNHITYEPLTWAKLVEEAQAGPVSEHSKPASRSTLEGDQSELGAKVNQYRSKVNQYRSNPLSDNVEAHGVQDQLVESNFTQDYNEIQLQLAREHEPLRVVNKSSSSHDINSLLDYHQLNSDMERQVLSMFDRGLYDGIKRVIFGGANHHWLDRVLLLDAIEHLSLGKILSPMERYIQIDIDDVFVGEQGKRMDSSDVEYLLSTQQRFAQRIDGGFRFNLGFSGKYFKHGNELENIGDEQLVAKASEFTWFCHTWSHSKAHLSNTTSSIETELKRNLEFAKEHKITMIGHDEAKPGEPLPPTYAIAPHHSGVYPVHQQLYQAWRSLLNVQVTSTEEYPHLRPSQGRRGFVHEAIRVLPRQTCGLYTHTIYRNKYPGGIDKLEASIRGGELFESILHNPVNIYMTHMSNYANDRLAPYTFSALIDFVQAHTNLQLRYAASDSTQLGPSKLADLYFKLYPNERDPLWTNPCSDKRHLAIWAPHKHHRYCSIVPKLLIVGPQKTGTTALHSYLKINPIFRSSLMSADDFEEIQFFNDKHYYRGVDWYLEKFRLPNGNHHMSQANLSASIDVGEYFYFDKSATYFDDPKAAQRAHSLLPEARIVIMLVNPADRAYSWYQHIRAHGDTMANSVSFEQVIMAREDETNKSLRSLRNRCLEPGYYWKHLSKWLELYPSHQIIIIDGLWFRYSPAMVMNRLQLLLRVERPIDYDKLLVYDRQKGFYCQRDEANKGTKCLGQSKGRRYPAMSEDARLFLNRLYWSHNRQLARLLSDIGQPLPTWLDELMNGGGRGSSVVY